MLRWYQARLARSPFLTQSITTSILFATGDTLAQQGVEKRGGAAHDYMRTGRMALYGGCVFGPVATAWYGFLGRRINLSSTSRTIGTRVGLDQLVFAPLHMPVFLSSMALLEGKNPVPRVQQAYWTALKGNWTVWPAVQGVNFALVPDMWRVMVVNVVSIGWNCYLSFLNSQGVTEKKIAAIP
ncbi:SYM1 protein [Lineolata rhizophorae]|uniref:SYM1 protein n=1 Tax=Lineolata rhizophorae TaxID=578093 RepID=A0A6A6NPL5_9PEZI|nr:SYM1 protein [Lineolata rhizophorae]